MAISTEFKDAVSQNKILRVKIMLKDSMVLDPTLNSFNEMIKYAESKISNLYDKHDGGELNYDESAWNKSYMDKQMVILVNNFSKERIELLKKVVKKLYSNRVKNIREKVNTNSNSTVHVNRKQIGTGISIGGAIVTIAGAVAGKTLLTGVGVVALVSGVVMAATDDN